VWYIFPVWVCFAKKNLATLLRMLGVPIQFYIEKRSPNFCIHWFKAITLYICTYVESYAEISTRRSHGEVGGFNLVAHADELRTKAVSN
jgi:hypothetical protein